jgi:uncharacterized protein
MKRERKYPNAINIFITEDCNLDCQYCFVNKNYKKSRLNFSSLKKTIDWFLTYPGQNKTISFNGGEPLLEYPLLKKAYLYALKKAEESDVYLDIAVMTNGTLLSPGRCRFLEKNQAIVKISIDGDKKTHDLNRPFKKKQQKSSSQEIISNLKNFKQKDKLKLSGSLVFTPQTVNSLFENIKFIQQLGLSYVEFYPDMYAFWSKKELFDLEKQFKRFVSYYISLFLNNKSELIFKNSLLDSVVNKNEVIGTKEMVCQKIHLAADGNFYFCDKVFSLPRPERKKYIIGNVREGIDNQKRLFLISQFRKKVLKLIQRHCQDCPYQEYCFCPIGHYLYFSFRNEDLTKRFSNFCQVAKIYFDNFDKINQTLKYHPLFVKLYKW